MKIFVSCNIEDSPAHPTIMKADKIMAIVNSIQDANVPHKEEYFATKYANFKQQYPTLYALACKGERVDTNTLQYMLNMLEQMNTSTISQYDASASVGQMLYDKYIHENIKDLPPTKK
jgi:hypothetical protein